MTYSVWPALPACMGKVQWLSPFFLDISLLFQIFFPFQFLPFFLSILGDTLSPTLTKKKRIFNICQIVISHAH